MDINHNFGADVLLSPTGDLGVVDTLPQSQQRILRRLLTPVDGYIWHPGYAIGVPNYVGATSSELDGLKALIISGLAQEPSVAQIPTPEITLKSDFDKLYCTIRYVDVETNSPQTLAFDTGGVA
jgi:hypothetical protein